MVKLRLTFCVLAAGAVLSGCIGNSGNPVDPPKNVTPVVGDGIAGVTWTPELGIVYTVFYSTNPDLTTQNWTQQAIAGAGLLNAQTKSVPPSILCNSTSYPGYLPNATGSVALPYYFTVDAHTGTSPAGPGSPTLKATPRPAGGLLPDGTNSWKTGGSMAVPISGVGYAAVTTCLATSAPTGIFAAVGPGGVIFTSADGISWTPRTSPISTDLYAVTSYSIPNSATLSVLFVGVGAQGAVVRSSDGVTWTSSVAANASAPNLNAIALAYTTFVAVGDAGRIQISPDGITWTTRTSNTTANLHSISCVGTTCVAVGDAGTVDLSFDSGTTWQLVNVGASSSTVLRAAGYGNFDNNETAPGVVGVNGVVNINTWVVAGDSGAVFQSTNFNSTNVAAITWNAAPITGAGNIVALGYTTQFVAIDKTGNAYTSQTATAGSWSAAVPTGVADAVSMITNGYGASDSHGYVLVGSTGDNATSF